MIAASVKDTVVPKSKLKAQMKEAISGGGTRQKRPKMMMDHAMTEKCSALLKALMKHPAAGMVFSPKALKKSDCFTTMENPMDFGAVESKLAKNTYVGIEEFAADIKLTFSNAMHYYHKMCEEMNKFVDARLKSLEESWNQQENLKVGDGGKDVCCSKAKLDRQSFLPKKSKPSESEMPLNAGAMQAEPPKPVQNSVNKLARKTLRKGCGGRAHGCINAKPPVSQGQGACKRCSCGSIKSQRSIRVCSPTDADSNGAVDGESVYLSSATDAASGEGLLFEAQKSPKKALHAAMLKSRYADTIVKAQLLVNVDKADPTKMQQEKAKLERRLCEEKAEAELELKKQREREREAARMALQNMENRAGIELNLDIKKEFEILIGCSPSQEDEDIVEGEIVS